MHTVRPTVSDLLERAAAATDLADARICFEEARSLASTFF